MIPEVTIYTDGSWMHRKQTGGWSCLMVSWPYWQVLSGKVINTTISRMELTAIATALEAITVPANVLIISDSIYSVKCINEWIPVWRLNHWLKSNNKPVENQDLLYRIDQQMAKHSVQARWVKAHTKRKGVDYLGNGCVDWFAQHNAGN